MAAALLLGLAVLGAAQATEPSAGLSLNGSRAIPIGEAGWIDPIEDFPARARRDGQGGTVLARVFVDRSGRVTGCLVREGPNVPALQAATCRMLRSRARFQPFSGPDLATYDYRIVWDLSKLPPVRRPNLDDWVE